MRSEKQHLTTNLMMKWFDNYLNAELYRLILFVFGVQEEYRKLKEKIFDRNTHMYIRLITVAKD